MHSTSKHNKPFVQKVEHRLSFSEVESICEMVVWHAVQACGQIHICIFNSHKRRKYPWLT